MWCRQHGQHHALSTHHLPLPSLPIPSLPHLSCSRDHPTRHRPRPQGPAGPVHPQGAGEWAAGPGNTETNARASPLCQHPCPPRRTPQHPRRIHRRLPGARRGEGLVATTARLPPPALPAHPPAHLCAPAPPHAFCGPPVSLPSGSRRKAAPWRSVPELAAVAGNTWTAPPSIEG